MKSRNPIFFSLPCALAIGAVACTITTDDSILDGGTKTDAGSDAGQTIPDASVDTGSTTDTGTGSPDTGTSDGTTESGARCQKPGDPCRDCHADKCCEELVACQADAKCREYLDCFATSDAGSLAQRGQECSKQDVTDSGEKFNSLIDCAYLNADKCKAACAQ